MKATPQKILVTGAAGYIASIVLRQLKERKEGNEVVGIDIRLPTIPIDGVRYLKADMLEANWAKLIEAEAPDVVVHLAFVVDPMHDEETMHRINVQGTKSTFKAAAKSAQQIVCLSSATAYGALPDNDVPLREDAPIRGDQSSFQYARDKGLLEHFYRSFQKAHAELKIVSVRPVIVYGPSVGNYLSRFIYALPIVPLVRGLDTPVQFVHEEDVAAVCCEIIRQQKTGAFNVAGDEWLTLAEVCQMARRPTMRVLCFVLWAMMQLMWKFHFTKLESPPTIIDYLSHPWVVNTDRVRDELGYQMRYSSRDAVEAMIASR